MIPFRAPWRPSRSRSRSRWALAVPMHWWPRLPRRMARRALVATSAGRASASSSRRCGRGPARVGAHARWCSWGRPPSPRTASASASLYYYVLTGVCLLLGFAGLTFGDAARPLARAAPAAELGGRRRGWSRRALPAREERGPRRCSSRRGRDLARARRRRLHGDGRATAPTGPAASLPRARLPTPILVRGFVAARRVVATRFGPAATTTSRRLTYVRGGALGPHLHLRAGQLAASSSG